MSPAGQYLSELVVFAICAMLAPQGQKETFVYPKADPDDCFKLVRTEAGLDILRIAGSRSEPAGSIKTDKARPGVFDVTFAKRTQTVDLSAVQKAIKDFAAAPEQRFIFRGVTVKIGGKGDMRFVTAPSEGVFSERRPVLLTPKGPEAALAETNPSGK